MTIRVVRDQQAPMRHEILIGPHSIASDLSVEEGGGGSKPNPHDLYDAALGACTALTVLWYAKRKNIPVEGLEVAVERDASQERAGNLSAECGADVDRGLERRAAGGASPCSAEVPNPQANDRGHDRDCRHAIPMTLAIVLLTLDKWHTDVHSSHQVSCPIGKFRSPGIEIIRPCSGIHLDLRPHRSQ